MSDDRVMIEDYIPVEQINAECAREKMGGHHISRGMPRNLHLWWARRPLAACRAAVYAAFAEPATGAERDKLPAFFTELCHWDGPVLPETDALRRAREVVSNAADGGRPKVLDMFAGGGAIPLEALRLGADAVALDLNPVAHLIQLCTLVYPQRYGKKLREAVSAWGEWVITKAQEEVGDLYPDLPVADFEPMTGDLFEALKEVRVRRPIAYIWTRTIPSPARGYERGMVPLVRQTWLCKKPGAFVALKPVVDRANLTVRYELVKSKARTAEQAVEEWGFDPAGQSVRGATTCPFSGNPVTAKDAKVAGKAGKMGRQLLAVVYVEPGRRGKLYAEPDQIEHLITSDEVIARRMEQLCDDTGLTAPGEPLAAEDHQHFQAPMYGMLRFGDLFTPRQQLLLLTLCANTREAYQRIGEESGDWDFAAGVAAFLGLLVGRVADRGSTLCRWEGKGGKTVNTYARQALPMVWDYSEASPFGGFSGDARMQLGYLLEVIDHVSDDAYWHPAEVIRGRAQKLPLNEGSIDAVITDPPYYDNISYADLSDFFYVWHKRALEPVFPAIYTTSITPKKVEIIAASHRHGNKKEDSARFYEEQMREAFIEAHRVLRPGGPMIVVYAHKTTLGWSTLVDSLRQAGFQVTEAWPLSTEREFRVGQLNTASLASSIFLIARKNPRQPVGNYATNVRPEMVRIVESRVRDLMAAGISGADLVIAAVGAGLRSFTRFDRVELPNGEELPSARFLEEIQREVLECVLAAVFEVDRSGVGQVDQPSRFYVLARYQYGPAQVEFGEINVMAQGLGIELAGAGSISDGKRRMAEVNKSKVAVLDFAERGKEPSLGVPANGASAPLIDVLHRLLWLMQNERAKVPAFLDEAQVEQGRLRLLANALKGRALSGPGGAERTDEQKAIDRLLAQWGRVVESRALPLFNGI